MDSTALQPGTTALESSSTVVNPNAVVEHISGGGKTDLTEKVENGSVESVLEAELAEIKAREAKDAKAEADGKDKPEAKAKDDKAEAPKVEKTEKPRAEDGKFAKAEPVEETDAAKAEKGAAAKGATGQEGSERRTSEGRHPEPPARFLPEARAKWANVPNEVKAEFHRVSQEYEAETQQFKASHERYAQLKQFDDLARSNGRDLRESLTKVNEIENAMQRNPIAGLDAVLREVGPRKSDGSPLTIMDVAQYLTQNPQSYQPGAPAPQASHQPAQPQPNPEIARLTEQVNALVANQTILPVVEKFSEGKPDFEALSDTIEKILSEGIVDRLYGTGLSLEQKLSEAYRIAGGQGPSSRSDTETALAHSDAARPRPVNPDAGKKSVRGAPADGTDTSVDDTDSDDIREMLRKQLRQQVA